MIGSQDSPSRTVVNVAGPDDGEPVNVFEGRYGPYVKHGKTNATIPKDRELEQVTLEDAVTMLAEKAARKGRGGGRKRTTKRKTTKKASTKKKSAKRCRRHNRPESWARDCPKNSAAVWTSISTNWKVGRRTELYPPR